MKYPKRQKAKPRELKYAFRDELRAEKIYEQRREDEIRKSRQCKLS